MRKKLTLLLFSFLVLIYSCNEPMTNTQKGVAIGAGAGAVAGGVIGNNVGKGNTALGAVIGSVVGGVVGGIIGSKMDREAREIEQAIPGAEVTRVGEGIVMTLRENAIRFEVGKSSLTAQARQNLDRLVPIFQEHADTYIEIHGHTDSTGSLQLNQRLSEDRALSVARYLISRGIASSRLRTKGFGPSSPVDTNETAAGRAANRRVEFAIYANEKMIEDARRQANQQGGNR